MNMKTTLNEAAQPAPVPPPGQHKRWIMLALPIVVAALLLLVPTPAGLEPYAWHFFAIFVGVIVGLIFEPLPGAVIGLTGVVVIALFSQFVLFSPAELAKPGFKVATEAFKWGVSGFGNSTVWLIFGAFMFAAGYDKTQFGRRLALILVKYLGRRSLTLGYASPICCWRLLPRRTPRAAAAPSTRLSPTCRRSTALNPTTRARAALVLI